MTNGFSTEYNSNEFFKIHQRKDFHKDFTLQCGKEFFCEKHQELEYILCNECIFGKGDYKGGKPL